MVFRRRTFPEVLENVLTNITGGVAAEAHPFPPVGASNPPFLHSLQQPPVADVVSVYGSRDGRSQLFRKGVDYKLADPQTLRWEEGAQLPDPGTLFYINYYPKSSQPILSDVHVGSVTRTLAETVSLEIASLYAQLEVVYQAGFIDTATGRALDNVVALLGITRIEGGRPSGEVEFTRSNASPGLISIPAGTRITTADGDIEYETTDAVTLAQGQNTIRVVARDTEVGNEPLAADALTVLPVPIAGIAKVTNPGPTAINTRNETDDDLRTRAKNFLHGSERATLGAIKHAISKQGVNADVVESADKPGYIFITLHAESISPELQQRVMQAVAEAKPAGIHVSFEGLVAPQKVNLVLRLTTAANMLEQDLRAIQRAVSEKIKDYFARLPAREAGSINRIVGLVLSVAGVEDVSLVSATLESSGDSVLNRDAGQLDISGFPTVLGNLNISDPNLPTLLTVVISRPAAQALPASVDIKAALNTALTYLNELNSTELAAGAPPAAHASRILTYGKLLRVVPLPNKPAASLVDFDTAAATGSPPALPDENSVKPYKVVFVFTLESGLSQELRDAGDAYALTPFERLALTGVEVRTEDGDVEV